ncbi:recombinase RecT [Embleya sp. AB8]|uniref:recombinase RecT n=1 Tax=Embleya sp. AB8 TaxID=3156304 RepID=UPI003C70AB3A
MALTTLKDRVRAATTERPEPTADIRPAQVVADATPEELHAAEQAEGGETTAAIMKWLDQYGEHFSGALPGCVPAATFMAATRAALPSLTRCTPASLLQALLTCARFGLLPDGRQAVIRCEDGRAVFVPMYQGYVELMYRSGQVGSVHVGLIRAGDEWSVEPSAPAPLDFTFKPALLKDPAERGEAVLAYAFAWLAGGARSQVIILTRPDAEAIRDQYSQAYQRSEESGARDSFWHTHFYEMWRKSALRRLFGLVPTSSELTALERADDAGDGGQVQVVHAPGEDVQALAKAVAAHRAAEGSPELQPAAIAIRPSSRKKSLPPRSQPKRTTRKSRKGKGKTR